MAAREWLDFLMQAIRKRFSGGSRIRRCAVLIDGDHVSPRAAGALLRYAATLGRVEVIEVFANFASSTNAGWAEQMRKNGIVGLQHYKTSNGKNAADAALIVRCMDLLHTARLDDYVLVSSDSDFAALAHRLRKSGASVHGIGSSDAAPALREGCTTFLTFEALNERAPTIPSRETAHGHWSRGPADAEELLLQVLIRLGGARQWVTMSALGEELRQTFPSFDPRTYSRRRLGDLCRDIDSVEVDVGSGPISVRLALRVRNGSSPEPAPKS